MGEFLVKIKSIEKITHDVNKIKIERPAGYDFIPGQATDVAINTADYKNEKRPFTFTGLTDWNELEFIIKSYNDHDGITKKIGELKPDNELLIGEPWGAINYNGQGMFLAGGAGITPFIAILRDLKKKKRLPGHLLFFSNKTESDIILKEELTEMLGNSFVNLLTRERSKDYYFGRIDEAFLRMWIVDVVQSFYVCGPEGFVKDINSILTRLGAKADSIIIEQ